jgi:hypothetical protein
MFLQYINNFRKMPPKKRKLLENEVSSDEEKKTKQNAKLSKLSDESSAKNTWPIFNKGSSSKKDASKGLDPSFGLEWVQFGEVTAKNVKPLIYLYSQSQPSRNKIAAFDIDNTIIVTKSGKKFATSKYHLIFLARKNNELT